jgi:hypothetical protein
VLGLRESLLFPAVPWHLRDELNADDVEAAVRIQSTADSYLFILELLRLFLVVKLIRAVTRYLQHVPAAILHDRALERLCCRLPFLLLPLGSWVESAGLVAIWAGQAAGAAAAPVAVSAVATMQSIEIRECQVGAQGSVGPVDPAPTSAGRSLTGKSTSPRG